MTVIREVIYIRVVVVFVGNIGVIVFFLGFKESNVCFNSHFG